MQGATPNGCLGRNFGLFCLIASLLVTIPAMAATITWNGSTLDWTNPAGWTGGLVPGSGDTALIASGTVTVSTSEFVGGLTFSGGTLAGTGTLTASGLFTWSDGAVSGNSGTLQADGGITINGTGGQDPQRPYGEQQRRGPLVRRQLQHGQRRHLHQSGHRHLHHQL